MFNGLKKFRAALLAGFLAMLCLGLIGWSYYQSSNLAKQLAGREVAQNFSGRIVERFYEAIGPTYMLASLVKKNGGVVTDFDTWAADLIHEFPLLKALELAPGGVVKHVYPLRGNEAVLGHDLLGDKARNKDAHLAVSKRQMTISGPVNLIQSGSAAIARYPVFIQNPNGRSSFWGFSIALVNVSDLLAVAGEMELEKSGCDYQLCRRRENGECEVFAWRGRPVAENSTVLNIGLLSANWVLTVSPQSDSGFLTLGRMIAAVVVLTSLIIACGVFFLGSVYGSTVDDELIS